MSGFSSAHRSAESETLGFTLHPFGLVRACLMFVQVAGRRAGGSVVRGRRVGSGWVVERLAFIVVALAADMTGVAPRLDGAGPSSRAQVMVGCKQLH
jgi:hypothetical protein